MTKNRVAYCTSSVLVPLLPLAADMAQQECPQLAEGAIPAPNCSTASEGIRTTSCAGDIALLLVVNSAGPVHAG
jgi:hypothetical protein